MGIGAFAACSWATSCVCACNACISFETWSCSALRRYSLEPCPLATVSTLSCSALSAVTGLAWTIPDCRGDNATRSHRQSRRNLCHYRRSKTYGHAWNTRHILRRRCRLFCIGSNRTKLNQRNLPRTGCRGGVCIGVADPSKRSEEKGLFCWPWSKSNSVWTVIGDSGTGVGVATGTSWAFCCWMASKWDWSLATHISRYINWISRSARCWEPIISCCWSGRTLPIVPHKAVAEVSKIGNL